MQPSQDGTDKRIFFILPYVKRTTDRIGSTVNNYNIRTVFK